jgi:segregation and condensation protein B
MSDANQPNPKDELSLAAQIEALLFVAPEAVSHGQLAKALDITPRRVEIVMEEIEQFYQGRGICIQNHEGRVRLTSNPKAAGIIEHFLGLEISTPFSRAALEALAIIAYQQPITRPQVDAVRGVNSDGVMRNLLGKGIIQEVGRAEGPGRPILYATTPEFLSHFGLLSIEELPPLNIEEITKQSDNGDMKILKE